MGAPAGLLRKDMTPKAAYYRIYDLIHKGWTTQAAPTVGDGGAVDLRGFYGDYRVVANVNGRELRGVFRNAKHAQQAGPIQVKLQ